MTKFGRAAAAFGHDLAMAALSFVLSLYLRVGDGIFNYRADLLSSYEAVFVGAAAAVFFASGLYRGIWRYASLPDLVAVLRAATLVMLVFFPLMFLVNRLVELPRSLVGINWLVLVALLGGPRFAYRAYRDGGLTRLLDRGGHGTVPVLLIGAGDGTALFIREMARDPQRPYRVVGVLGIDAAPVGRELGGVPVLGTVDDLPAVVERLDRRSV